MRGLLGYPLLVLCVGCANAGSGAADAAIDARPIDAQVIDAPRLVTLDQTDSQVVTPRASPSCNQMGPPQVSRENSYYRVFELRGWAIDRPFTPLEVKFGIEQATASLGSQPIELLEESTCRRSAASDEPRDASDGAHEPPTGAAAGGRGSRMRPCAASSAGDMQIARRSSGRARSGSSSARERSPGIGAER